jgi:hypothetical protein
VCIVAELVTGNFTSEDKSALLLTEVSGTETICGLSSVSSTSINVSVLNNDLDPGFLRTKNRYR